MRKPVSVRRQKKNSEQTTSVSQVVEKQDHISEFKIEEILLQKLQDLQKGEVLLLEKIDALLLEQQHTNTSLTKTEKSQLALEQLVVSLQQKISSLQQTQSSVFAQIETLLHKVSGLSLLSDIQADITALKSIGREDYKTILSILLDRKNDKDTERTISFQLGKTLIDGKKNIENLLNLPNRLVSLRDEAKLRKQKDVIQEREIKTIDSSKLIPASSNSSGTITQTTTTSIVENKISVLEQINKDNPLIAYNYLKGIWPKTQKKARFISILDEISENSWANEFTLYGLNKNDYQKQIQGSTSNALFIESCWKGNKGTWEYAFTSPGLKHANAQKLLDALSIAKSKGMPIIFWNKEDPMHYEKFLPIAEKCDVIFTTDENRVSNYKTDLPNKKVYAMEFAANQYICNPVNRNRYEEETICFAGSYYSVGHDDRKVQMDQLLPALLEFNGAIYDRMSNLNNERYFFPEQYRHLIRDAVDFKTMSVLYKKFKIFLNVNTITDSPTMMSRRVYELLACGTPVISTPSYALEKQFPNIVQIARNADEAIKIAKDLLTDEWKYRHIAHLGYREVMLNHTYAHRVGALLKSVDVEYKEPKAKVSVIMATMREHFIDRILVNIGRQNYGNIELIIVTQNFSKIAIQKLKNGLNQLNNLISYKVLEINSEMTLGARLNQAAEQASGDYLAKMDDDDFYFENYLTDMLIPFSYGNFGLVGKKEMFIYLEESDKTILRYHNQSHRVTDFVTGATLVFKTSVFKEVGGFSDLNRGEDSTIIEKLRAAKILIYTADPFNFVVWRGKDTENHTWKVEDEFFLKNALVFNGFAEKEVIV